MPYPGVVLTFFGLCVVALNMCAQHVGETRAQIVERLGAPSGTLRVGEREILTYPKARLIFEDGILTKIEHSASTGTIRRDNPNREGAMDPKPAALPEVPNPPVLSPRGWFIHAGDAMEAARRHQLPLFLAVIDRNEDPAIRIFEQQVAHLEEFLNFAQNRVVLLRIDRSLVDSLPLPLRETTSGLLGRLEQELELQTGFALLRPDGRILSQPNLSHDSLQQGEPLVTTMNAIQAGIHPDRSFLDSYTVRIVFFLASVVTIAFAIRWFS